MSTLPATSRRSRSTARRAGLAHWSVLAIVTIAAATAGAGALRSARARSSERTVAPTAMHERIDRVAIAATPRSAVAQRIALAPSRARRLFDTEGPLVTMPQSGNVYSKNLSWLIQFCDDSSLNASSRSITRNGSPLPDTYTTGTKRACGAYATSAITISNLVAGVPTTIHAEIKDNAGNLGYANSTITYVPTYTVTVTPDSNPVSRQSDVNGTQPFTFTNTGSETAIYNWTASCSGGVTCTSTTGSVQIDSKQTAKVNVAYHTGIGPTQGTVGLSAVAQQDPTATGSGSMTVNVAALPTSVVSNATLPGWTGYERSSCLAFGIVPGVAAQCDAFRITEPLPAVFTRGKARVPTLVHYSDWIVGPGFSVNLAVPTSAPVPDSVKLTAYSRTWNNSSIAFDTSRTWAWGSTYGHSPERLSVFPYEGGTGIYRYRLEVRYWYNSNPGWQLATGAIDGEILRTQRRGADSFGSAWWLAGVEQLVFGQITAPAPTDSVLMWIGGDGSMRKYVWQSVTGTKSTYLAANSLDGPDTLVHDTSMVNPWMRLAGNNVRVVFDNYGRHVMTINRVNDTTRFAWKTGGALRLDTLIVPGGLRYVFNHDASDRLTSVDAPPTRAGGAVRTTQIIRSVVNGGVGLGIQKFIESSGDSVMFDWVGWATDEYIGGRTDRNGVRTALVWENLGPGLASATTPVGDGTNVVHQWTNQANLGMDYRTTPISLGAVYTRYTNPRGYGTTFFLNTYGAPDSIVDALNRKTKIAYGDARFPGLATQVVAPNGLTSQMAYNARGLDSASTVVNPLGTGQNAVTTYSWDSTWDVVTAIHRPSGASDSSFYNDTTGNLLWQQDGRGSASRVNYSYDTQNRVIAVQAPGNTQKDSIFYDATLGNVVRTKSAMGFTAWSYKDAVGRDTLSVTPIDSLQQLKDSTWTHYNAAGEVDSTLSIGPAVPYTMRVYASQGTWDAPLHRDTLVVLKSYDHEGRLTIVNTNVMPADTTSDMLLREGYSYDGLGRQKTHFRTHAFTETTTYDAAGNVISFTRPSGTVTSTYDALDRVLTRIVPSRTYARQRCEGLPPSPITPDSTGNPTQCFEVYPAFPTNADTGYTIAADTATFSYDPVSGAMLTADNLYAKVHRSYYPNGALKGDTLIFRSGPRTYDGSGNSTGPEWTTSPLGSYAIGLQYDLDGRRAVVTTPFSGNLTYAYRSDNGALQTITDGSGNWVRYTYDAPGRLDSLVFGPSGGAKGVWETHVYDADGRQTRRIRRTAASSLFDESFWFDAQGRPVKVGRFTAANGAPMDTTYFTYAGLGAVQSRERIDQNFNWESEEYRVDALGNVVLSRNGISNNGGAQDPRATHYGFRGDLQSRLTTDTTREQEWYYQWFDGDGNVSRRFNLVRNSTSHAYTTDVQSRSYYDAANRLRATQVYNSGTDGYQSGTFDEMFYDALGRRVVTSSRRNLSVPACTGITFCIRSLCTTSDCGSTLTFTIWDGSQVLAEDRAGLGNYSSYDVGRVTYVHGGGTDQPVAVLDSRVTGGMRVAHPTWRGQYESSSTPSGAAADCSLGGGTCEYIRWNATGAIYQRPIPGPLTGGFSYTFAGTLLLDQQDASGLLYRRNRYYDPSSGRFTQEDPAGLAGGLNSYGFASGDPVNYADPFGLCKESQLKDGLCPGGLTQAEWKRVEDVEKHMSRKAARYTDRLLNQGRIHGTSNGTQPGNPGYVKALDAPRDININRTYKDGNAFFTDQLGPTLVHEGRHVQQFAHIQPECSENCSQVLLYKLRNVQKLEDDANRYEQANYSAPKP